jgi:hypothetical protein
MKILKKLVFTLSCLMAFSAIAQDFPTDPSTAKITYSEVVKTDSSLNKKKLFTMAQQLCNTRENITINSAEDFIFEFKTQVTVKYPSNIQGMNHQGTVEYITNIACRDGRYKYIITDFVHSSAKGNGGKLENESAECGKHILTNAGWASIKKQVFEHMAKNTELLKKNMQPEIKAPVKNDDW